MDLAHSAYPASAQGIPTEVFLYHLPSHEEWSIGLNASNAVRDNGDFTYVCLHLLEEELSHEVRAHLESLGAECLMDGTPYHAYCIVKRDDALLEALKQQPEIVDITFEEPPCAK